MCNRYKYRKNDKIVLTISKLRYIFITELIYSKCTPKERNKSITELIERVINFDNRKEVPGAPDSVGADPGGAGEASVCEPAHGGPGGGRGQDAVGRHGEAGGGGLRLHHGRAYPGSGRQGQRMRGGGMMEAIIVTKASAKEIAALVLEVQGRLGSTKTENGHEREALIRVYERRLAKLKEGASPVNVIF